MESIKKIETQNAPKAIGPYSQAISVSLVDKRLVFVSGQLPIDPKTGKLVEGDIGELTCQVFENIRAILIAANSDFNQVIRVEIFLTDLNNFSTFNKEYAKFFHSTAFPARQTIQVAKLPLDSPLEISCIAIASHDLKTNQECF